MDPHKTSYEARVSGVSSYVFHLLLCSYDYNMHVEVLLPANLFLVTLVSSEQLFTV